MIRKGQNPERYKLLALSTAHISVETANRLTNEEIDQVICYRKGDYGFFLHVPYDDIEEEENRSLIPDDLLNCLDYAKAKESEWIMFDADAATYEELPLYDWDTGNSEPSDIDSDTGYDPYLGCTTDYV